MSQSVSVCLRDVGVNVADSVQKHDAVLSVTNVERLITAQRVRPQFLERRTIEAAQIAGTLRQFDKERCSAPCVPAETVLSQ